MKRREKKLSVMDWVLVGLLDTLAGVVAGGLMAIWQLPSATAGVATGQSAANGCLSSLQSSWRCG